MASPATVSPADPSAFESHDVASTPPAIGDSITVHRSRARREVTNVNIEKLERPIEPASAVTKGT
jgi:hypothetical protein